jgi:N-acetylmuramic acid 6-phosphate (MurNAc-6-P) etherase
VKRTIVMARRDVDAATADTLLREANGFLSVVLGE